ncbi:MAG TPA: hypothetical protein P5075_06195 [Eubacteriales bacterium]|nr:hypothetical protein [Eubacteriales bacterium]
MIPAPILAGLLGFALMNSGLLQLDYAIYERITFHLFTLSFISITFMSINAPKRDKKGVFKGGLWLALIFGMMISVQALIGSAVFLGYDFFTGADLLPALGGMITHGFAQGPGQAVAIGTIWEGFGVENAAQYGLFYAASGYVFAFVFGVPFAKRLLKQRMLSGETPATQQETNALGLGLIRDEEKPVFGNQTAHHANLDTLTLHASLIGVTYLLAYGFAEGITRFVLKGASSQTLVFGNMFVWGILFAFLIKAILKKTKFTYVIDPGVQGSITGFLVDTLTVSAMLAINIKLVFTGLVPMLINIAVVFVVTFFLVRYFARRSGACANERFLAEFGIVTGTAATGLILLRIVDPQFKTPVAGEMVWWNILNLFVGILVILSQIAIPITNFWLWIGILTASIPVFLVLLKVFGLWGKKSAE